MKHKIIFSEAEIRQIICAHFDKTISTNVSFYCEQRRAADDRCVNLSAILEWEEKINNER